MQWPGKNPGALVVVAEDLEPDPALGERRLWVLFEFESKNLSELSDKCVQMKEFLQIEKIYGNTKNRPMLKLMRQGEFKIRLSKAPFVDDPDVDVTYLALTREKVLPDKEVLYFEKESMLPGILSSLPTKTADLQSEYPKVAALGYALSALMLHPFKKPRPHIPSYSPLNPVVGI